MAFGRGSEWLRRVACTLARRGVAFRRAFPDRAESIILTLSASPIYKGGQFLFDLLEWEDFMIDGDPPPILSTTLDPMALQRLAGLLQQAQAYLDSGVSPAPIDQPLVRLAPLSRDDDALPPLEPGFYLYQDVVLGLLVSTRDLPRSAPGGEAARPA